MTILPSFGFRNIGPAALRYVTEEATGTLPYTSSSILTT